MASFVDNEVTDAGRALLTEMQLGAAFRPTKLVLGSGYLPEGTTAQTITDVVTPEVTLEISKCEKGEEDTAIIGATFTNENVTEAFYYRELGLYAKAIKEDGTELPEVLYSYGNAGSTADYIPANTSGSAIERVIDLITYIGNDTEVNVTVTSGVYIPMKEKAAANGVASLDGNADLKVSQLPWYDAEFSALMEKYGYSYTMEEDEETGDITIPVTIAEGYDGTATLTAVISEDLESGDITISVTTTIDGVTRKMKHVLTDTTGEGGIDNE